MTKHEFYMNYWPKIKGELVDIKSGYHKVEWTRSCIIENAYDRGREVYLKYFGGVVGPSTIRSIHGIATSTETDMKK